jgi:hypothetical protein
MRKKANPTVADAVRRNQTGAPGDAAGVSGGAARCGACAAADGAAVAAGGVWADRFFFREPVGLSTW